MVNWRWNNWSGSLQMAEQVSENYLIKDTGNSNAW